MEHTKPLPTSSAQIRSEGPILIDVRSRGLGIVTKILGDGIGRVKLVRVVVTTDNSIDPALDTLLLKTDCDDPCKQLKNFFREMSHDSSF